MKRNLAVLADQEYDLIVIGGGIYGAFVVWEAVLRGLSVALVEKGDFGSATSSNSQKIIHGGFRYLQHADFKRVRESVYERTALMRIAPHLIHPLPVLIPTYGHGMRGKEILKMALTLYDLVSFDRNSLKDPQKKIPPGHLLPRDEVLKIAPNLPREKLTGGGVFYDAQVYNSERLLLSILKSSEKAGARLANYVRVIGFLEERDCIKGVEVEDTLTKERLIIRAKMVINTSGPWVYQVLGLLDRFKFSTEFPLVKSVNVVTPMLFQDYAVGIYGKNHYEDKDAILSKGARLFFVTPWRGHSVVGTALSYYDQNPDGLKVTRSDIQEFLDDFNRAYPGVELKREDVSLVHRGFLPSAGLGKTKDVQISKKYRILDHRREGVRGLISVVGVKYTTARDVAEKTIDYVFQVWNQKPPNSVSSKTPVYGGKIERFEEFLRDELKRRPFGLREDLMRSLIYNYGSAYAEVLEFLDSKNSQDTKPEELLKAEVLHGVREEMAQKLTDIVLRRTELGSLGPPEEMFLKICAETMQKELGWGSARTQQELEEVHQAYALSD